MDLRHSLQRDEYVYQLSDNRIAQYPLTDRSASKLLVYRQGEIQEDIFTGLDSHLPEGSLLVLNNTKVIHVRLLFETSTGDQIEIFCLEPVVPGEMTQALESIGGTTWLCMVGKNRKWPSGEELELQLPSGGGLFAERGQQREQSWEISFHWDTDQTFAEIFEECGHVPLPPYMKRSDEKLDTDRYQTVFAKKQGAVAAPTASLHLTDQLLNTLRDRGVQTTELTLHVGAGTFLPVKTENIQEHHMHSERVVITRKCIDDLLQQRKNNRAIIPVGTTAMRSLESLYWYEVARLQGDKVTRLDQWIWCKDEASASPIEILESVLEYMKSEDLDELTFETSLMIIPGYEFQLCDGLITNFHQPGSTLLMLVAAFIGEDWKRVYDYALQNDFRFLSYGDGSLLIP